MADGLKLDYRCLGKRCLQATQCRRFLTGTAAKNCTAPLAAFDSRRTAESCDGFLPRIHETLQTADRSALETNCTHEG